MIFVVFLKTEGLIDNLPCRKSVDGDSKEQCEDHEKFSYRNRDGLNGSHDH